MKSKVIQFMIDFVLMSVMATIVEYIFYKLNLVEDFSFSYLAGFMIGWTIWQAVSSYIDNKKNNSIS